MGWSSIRSHRWATGEAAFSRKAIAHASLFPPSSDMYPTFLHLLLMHHVLFDLLLLLYFFPAVSRRLVFPYEVTLGLCILISAACFRRMLEVLTEGHAPGYVLLGSLSSLFTSFSCSLSMFRSCLLVVSCVSFRFFHVTTSSIDVVFLCLFIPFVASSRL